MPVPKSNGVLSHKNRQEKCGGFSVSEALRAREKANQKATLGKANQGLSVARPISLTCLTMRCSHYSQPLFHTEGIGGKVQGKVAKAAEAIRAALTDAKCNVIPAGHWTIWLLNALAVSLSRTGQICLYIQIQPRSFPLTRHNHSQAPFRPQPS